MAPIRRASSILVVGWLWSSVPATAQPLGTFRWQMLPYCNVLTLNVSQQGDIYTLDGTDDRCGQAASARGLAFLNPNGTIGFGVTIVQPGGVPVHLEATLNAGSFNGTWRDSSGASGLFALTPGAGIGGPQRLVSASGIAPASITAVQLAPSAVGSAAIADGSVTIADLLDEPTAAFADGVNEVSLTTGLPTTIRQVTLVAPTAGRVIVSTSGWIHMPSDISIDYAYCAITTGAGVPFPLSAYVAERSAGNYRILPLGGARGFNVTAGSFTVRLNCLGLGASIVDASLTAIFVAGS